MRIRAKSVSCCAIVSVVSLCGFSVSASLAKGEPIYGSRPVPVKTLPNRDWVDQNGAVHGASRIQRGPQFQNPRIEELLEQMNIRLDRMEKKLQRLTDGVLPARARTNPDGSWVDQFGNVHGRGDKPVDDDPPIGKRLTDGVPAARVRTNPDGSWVDQFEKVHSGRNWDAEALVEPIVNRLTDGVPRAKITPNPDGTWVDQDAEVHSGRNWNEEAHDPPIGNRLTDGVPMPPENHDHTASPQHEGSDHTATQQMCPVKPVKGAHKRSSGALYERQASAVSQTPAVSQVPTASQTPAVSFLGSWREYGLIFDTPTHGTYELGGARTGVINGALAGNTLTGTWCNDPSNESSNKGKFTFTLSADGKTFTGKYGYGDGEQVQSWDGTRQ